MVFHLINIIGSKKIFLLAFILFCLLSVLATSGYSQEVVPVDDTSDPSIEIILQHNSSWDDLLKEDFLRAYDFKQNFGYFLVSWILISFSILLLLLFKYLSSIASLFSFNVNKEIWSIFHRFLMELSLIIGLGMAFPLIVNSLSSSFSESFINPWFSIGFFLLLISWVFFKIIHIYFGHKWIAFINGMVLLLSYFIFSYGLYHSFYDISHLF